MRYPIQCKNIIDVTKPPYNADNTGKTDCTDVLRKVIDDIMIREVQGVQETYERLRKLSNDFTIDVYDGFENRVRLYETEEAPMVNVIYPEYAPDARIIYFPNGTYLVSDTITYTFDNLKNIYLSKYYSELCRGIHILGESREGVVIRLADYAEGFFKDSHKPVFSFNNAEKCCEKFTTNVAQMNTIEDMTIDCGKGNPGVVGIRFCASNTGRVENITLRTQEGYCAVQTAVVTEGCIVNLSAEGFDYGIDSFNSHVGVFQDLQLSGNKRCAIKTGNGKDLFYRITCSPLPLVEFYDVAENKGTGIYYFSECDGVPTEDTKGNKVYVASKEDTVGRLSIPVNPRSSCPEDYICVDDFGAVGDGKTDSTEAIQAAFNSGKPIVLFGEGHYLVDGEITIPATVKTIDFMYCDMFAGEKLKNTRGGALFHINEASDDMLFMENLYTFEQFFGHFRLIKHGAVRDLCLSDLHTQAAAMYFNTVSGSTVYLDNCAVTVGDYAQNVILMKAGRKPEYTYVIPYEFHGQRVYARQFNPERADVELLNDASIVYVDGTKVEGPGTAFKTVNGGRTVVNVMSAGIGNAQATNALIETENGNTLLTCARISGPSERLMYNIIFKDSSNGKTTCVTSKDLTDYVGANVLRLGRYQV